MNNNLIQIFLAEDGQTVIQTELNGQVLPNVLHMISERTRSNIEREVTLRIPAQILYFQQTPQGGFVYVEGPQ